jgi:hypothetical protein
VHHLFRDFLNHLETPFRAPDLGDLILVQGALAHLVCKEEAEIAGSRTSGRS